MCFIITHAASLTHPDPCDCPAQNLSKDLRQMISPSAPWSLSSKSQRTIIRVMRKAQSLFVTDPTKANELQSLESKHSPGQLSDTRREDGRTKQPLGIWDLRGFSIRTERQAAGERGSSTSWVFKQQPHLQQIPHCCRRPDKLPQLPVSQVKKTSQAEAESHGLSHLWSYSVFLFTSFIRTKYGRRSAFHSHSRMLHWLVFHL